MIHENLLKPQLNIIHNLCFEGRSVLMVVWYNRGEIRSPSCMAIIRSVIMVVCYNKGKIGMLREYEECIIPMLEKISINTCMHVCLDI